MSGLAHRFLTQASKPRNWLVVLLIALAGYRFSLIGSGHCFFADEWAYDCAAPLIDHLSVGEYFFGVIQLYTPSARPGFVLISVIPTVLQRAAGALAGIDPGSLRYYDAAAAFNVLVSLGVSGCIFTLGRIWTRSSWHALFITVVYSLLCNTNVWIRHLVPYNESLLLLLSALCIASSEPPSRRQAFYRALAAGFLSALAFACYPAYYLGVLINLAVLLAVFRPRLMAGTAYGAAAASVVAAFELAAWSVGTSYFAGMLDQQARQSRWASAPWNQGSVEEGYVFVWRYLKEVEGPVGVFIFVLFAACVVFVLVRRGRRLPWAARAGTVAAVACYLLHATRAEVFQSTIFFGRYFGLYLPFLVCGAVLSLQHIPFPRVRRLTTGAVILVSVWSFADFARRYAQVTYPADLLEATMAGSSIDVPIPRHIEGLGPEFAMVVDGLPEGLGTSVASHEAARVSGARFIAVNLKCMYYSPERYEPFAAPQGYALVVSAVHPTAFVATAFESCPPQVRKRLRERRHTMRIYEQATGGDVGSIHARKSATPGCHPEDSPG